MSEINIDVLCETADGNLLTVFPRSQYGHSREELRAMKRQRGKKSQTPKQGLKSDRLAVKVKATTECIKKKYAEALKVIEQLMSENKAATSLHRTIDTYVITPKVDTKTTEGTVVWVASDWHQDERVDGETISQLNHFTPAIAQKRADTFFRGGLRLTDILARDVEVKTIVLALLGDFFTGHIHPDFGELTDTQPIHAAIRVQNTLASGIQFILDNSTYDLVIPCHSGNHARTTEKVRSATENGHSLEFYMYNFLADHFKGEPRVKFLIATGYHSYLDIYGTKVRFHHGHELRYAGGVGGIYIPVGKAIAQWNKANRADLDIFGHFHQMRDGGNFICNGSLIGYNAFALSIKADFEKPRQALLLIDSKRGKTCVWPIVLE
jgi:hypothetical protein